MNIEDLKMAWQEYDSRLQATNTLSSQIVKSMIRDRSESRLSKIIRQHAYGIFYMIFWLLAGVAILLGNPFDYTRTVEYIPVSIFCISMAILIVGLYNTYAQLKTVNIDNDNIDSSLRKIISVYDKPNRFMFNAIKLLLFSATVLFPLSFLPRKIESLGFWPGFMDTMIPIAISIATVWLAYKLGAFKERQAEKFRKDMEELDSLKRISEELKSEV
jgi:hypothetical protein